MEESDVVPKRLMRLGTVALLLLFVVICLVAAALMLHRRRSPPRIQQRPSSQSRPSISPPPRRPQGREGRDPLTGHGGRRRSTAASVIDGPGYQAHRRVAEGRAQPGDVVPNAVNQHPEWDWRPRVALPFEESLFHARIDALEGTIQSAWRGRLFTKWQWWDWWAHENRALGLVSALAVELERFSEPERARCSVLLDVWLSKGVGDGFCILKARLNLYRSLSLAEVHRREADTLEFPGGEDWLLCMVLGSMIATMENAGVLRQKLPSLRCPACHDTFMKGGTEERVRLVCFFPCSHWMNAECWEAWTAVHPAAYDSCPYCGSATMRAPVGAEYVGRMVSWRSGER